MNDLLKLMSARPTLVVVCSIVLVALVVIVIACVVGAPKSSAAANDDSDDDVGGPSIDHSDRPRILSERLPNGGIHRDYDGPGRH